MTTENGSHVLTHAQHSQSECVGVSYDTHTHRHGGRQEAPNTYALAVADRVWRTPPQVVPVSEADERVGSLSTPGGAVLVAVRCPRCGKRHTHGLGDGVPPFGSRWCHCDYSTLYLLAVPAAMLAAALDGAA